MLSFIGIYKGSKKKMEKNIIAIQIIGESLLHTHLTICLKKTGHPAKSAVLCWILLGRSSPEDDTCRLAGM
jgi:hypothetical protein